MLSKMLFPLLFVLVMPVAHAGEAAPTHEDVALEKRVMALSEHLRCLVCQNQTIADSHAELAIDLKNQVREKLREGQTEKQILDYMVERYGDFVLFKPQVKSNTWLLWFGPFVLLALGLVALVATLRKRRKLVQQLPGISAEERARAASLLSGIEEGDRS